MPVNMYLFSTARRKLIAFSMANNLRLWLRLVLRVILTQGGALIATPEEIYYVCQLHILILSSGQLICIQRLLIIAIFIL